MKVEKEGHKVVMIEKDGNINKAQLGVMIENGDGGVLVNGFAEGSPAEAAGLIKGDVISMVNGKQVSTIQSLVTMIGEHKAGDKIEVSYIRGDLEKQVEVTLAARSPSKFRKFNWKETGKN